MKDFSGQEQLWDRAYGRLRVRPCGLQGERRAQQIFYPHKELVWPSVVGPLAGLRPLHHSGAQALERLREKLFSPFPLILVTGANNQIFFSDLLGSSFFSTLYLEQL